MRQWIVSALVPIMACCLFGAKPLFEPMLGYCKLYPRNNIRWNLIKILDFRSWKPTWKCRIPNGIHSVQGEMSQRRNLRCFSLWLSRSMYVSFRSPGPVLDHDDVIKWKHFPRYWPFVRGIHRSPVNSHHKGQWRGASMFYLICTWINDWANRLSKSWGWWSERSSRLLWRHCNVSCSHGWSSEISKRQSGHSNEADIYLLCRITWLN